MRILVVEEQADDRVGARAAHRRSAVEVALPPWAPGGVRGLNAGHSEAAKDDCRHDVEGGGDIRASAMGVRPRGRGLGGRAADEDEGRARRQMSFTDGGWSPVPPPFHDPWAPAPWLILAFVLPARAGARVGVDPRGGEGGGVNREMVRRAVLPA